MSKKALVVMAKRPFPGQTKTRLTPPFTPEEAALLYESFLQDSLQLVRTVPGVIPFVAYAPADQETAAYFHQLAPDFELVAQTGAALGERLDAVLTGRLDQGYDQVAAMNSDSPTLPAAFLEEAFTRLDDPDTDVVLGPCDDGGYYLIGWKRPQPRLVREVQMSTDRVLADTLAIAAEEGLQVSLIAPWYDVDNMADLRRIQFDVLQSSPGAIHTRRFLAKVCKSPKGFCS
jgi:hypothetical protein